jgi:hypothetical protein
LTGEGVESSAVLVLCLNLAEHTPSIVEAEQRIQSPLLLSFDCGCSSSSVAGRIGGRY